MQIPFNRIRFANDAEVIEDPQYSRLFERQFTGIDDVGLTRMRVGDITPGFYLYEAGKARHVLDFDASVVPGVVERIRKGFRPAIEIYWNPLCPKPVKWVCPDDEAVLLAYTILKFDWVPCVVYKPAAAKGAHALLIIGTDEGVLTLRKSVPPPAMKGAPCMVTTGEHDGLPVLDRLVDFCEQSRTALREFHLPSNEELHYHQMLDSFLRRHIKSLRVIRQLLSEGHFEHACAIVRMAYEAFLNLYIDWLSPELIGPRMQLFSRAQIELREPEDEADAERKRKVMRRLVGFDALLQNTRRKAHISPLGDIFHDIIYPSLSSVVHQLYGHIERETVDFGSDAEPVEPERLDILCRWIDVITTSILIIVQNEVGKPIAVPGAG